MLYSVAVPIAPPPLSLYIHIPWCERKCPYCDFNSHRAGAALPQSEYVAALLADLDQELPDVWGRRVHSVFIGGGTPSLFDAATLDELLSGVRARLNLGADTEITLEANPGSSEQQRTFDHQHEVPGIDGCIRFKARARVGTASLAGRKLADITFY